ncbi:MAG: hypothetical protein VKO39_11820 [Cyanobacteriota bacterium]|nr:hypothetical protein [Cyanobacteriota bacterium]
MPYPSQGDSLDREDQRLSVLSLEEIFDSDDGMKIFRLGSAYEPTAIDILEQLLQGEEFNLERDKLEKLHYLLVALSERIMEQLQRDG